MDNLQLPPEFTPRHYLLLLLLLLLASCGSAILSWFLPAAANQLWLSVLPPLLGVYLLLQFFRTLGILQLPGMAVYSVLLAPLTLLSLQMFIS